MRAVWIDDGNTFDTAKLDAHGIERVYYAANALQASAGEFTAAKNAGFDVGVYAAWNWDNWTPEQFAQWVHGRLLQIGSALNPWVCLDIETHDVSWIRRALVEWRRLRPSRRTDWTLEPMQGGLFSLDDAKAINALGIGVVPQHYGGAMQPFAADRVAIDLISRGFNLLSIQGFYDAASLPLDWSGYAFTQGRLP
jgi:hypothetical protein